MKNTVPKRTAALLSVMALSAAPAFVLVGCSDNSNSAEEVGESIDDAADETGDAIDDAVDEIDG